MGMLEAGAAGETKAGINRVFRYPSKDLHAELGALRQSASRVVEPAAFDESDPQITSIANSVWVDQTVALKPEYVRILQDAYNAPPTALDFNGQPEASRVKINDWVEAKTNGRIEDLLNKSNVGPSTRLVLVNTVYMMSHWQSVFSERQTKVVPFYTEGTDAEPRKLMHQLEEYQSLLL